MSAHTVDRDARPDTLAAALWGYDDALHHGMTERTNPYDPNTHLDEHCAWSRGWREGDAELNRRIDAVREG